MYFDKCLFIFFMLFTIGQKMFIRFIMLAIHTKVKLIIILCKMKCIFYCGRGKSDHNPPWSVEIPQRTSLVHQEVKSSTKDVKERENEDKEHVYL
jgi:hypothetical protein